MVLSRGNTIEYADMYRGWAGHDPQIQPYLDYYGLNGGAATPAPAAPAQEPSKTERGN
jgi:peptidyl-dipeptidase Dcp